MTCETEQERVEEIDAEIASLQDELQTAPPSRKGAIVQKIKEWQKKGVEAKKKLDECLRLNPPPPPPPHEPMTVLFGRFQHGPAGWFEITLKPNGFVRRRGYMAHDGIEGFTLYLNAVVRSTGSTFALAYQRTGHVEGKAIAAPSTVYEWDEWSVEPGVKSHYAEFATGGELQLIENYKGDITGALVDILDVLLRFAVGAIVVPTGLGALILIGGEIGSLFATGSLVPGARIIEGVLWLAGPDNMLYALAADGIATVGSRQREMTSEEYEWANASVFRGSLPPRQNIIITDTIGGRNAEFVFPRFDGKITVNLGARHYETPKDLVPSTFIHELTHVWQVFHTPIGASWVASGLAAQICNTVVGNVYDPGPANKPFSEYNLEQQATIVARWFDAITVNPAKESTHPYTKYINENIRVGRV